MARTDIATSEAASNQDADSDQMERLVGVGVGWKLGVRSSSRAFAWRPSPSSPTS